MVKSYEQHLMETALALSAGQPVQQRADKLNLVHAIIEGQLTPDQIVEQFLEDRLPQVYTPNKPK